MREGALDFLAKPVDPDHLLLIVERAQVRGMTPHEELRRPKCGAVNRPGVTYVVRTADGRIWCMVCGKFSPEPSGGVS